MLFSDERLRTHRFNYYYRDYCNCFTHYYASRRALGWDTGAKSNTNTAIVTVNSRLNGESKARYFLPI